jgi:uncharacterized membrane protein
MVFVTDSRMLPSRKITAATRTLCYSEDLIVQIIKLYLMTVPIFFAIDMLWLGLVARKFYQNQLAGLLRPDVNWTAALVFYAVYIAGIIIFAVTPALEKQSLSHAIRMGALFGFFTYATYDLTNLATLKDWPVLVAGVDIVWGVILCSAVAAASYGVGQWHLT